MLALAVASSEPLTSSGGPRRRGQQELTKLSCSAIFFTCSPVAASHARTDLCVNMTVIYLRTRNHVSP